MRAGRRRFISAATLPEIVASEREPWRGGVAERPFVLLAQQSLFDPSRAPAGKHTAWAYCHVPNGSPVDMTERIEAQVERFAPGFRDLILARSAMGPAELELHNANYVGGDINGGAADLRQTFAQAGCGPPALLDAAPGRLPLLVVDAAGRRRSRHVRLPCRARWRSVRPSRARACARDRRGARGRGRGC